MTSAYSSARVYTINKQENCMTTSESKGRFFLQNESIRIDSHNESNRIDSNREVECSIVSALLRGNWQNFNWHDASRGPSAIAELLVYCITGLTISGLIIGSLAHRLLAHLLDFPSVKSRNELSRLRPMRCLVVLRICFYLFYVCCFFVYAGDIKVI